MKLPTLLSLSALILTSTAITTSSDKQTKRLTRRPDVENDRKVRYEKKCGLTSTTIEIINLANDLDNYQTDVFIYKVSDFYPGFTSLDLINEDSGFDCFEASSMFENDIQDSKTLVYCKVTCHAHGDIDDQYQEIVDISEKTFIRYFKDIRHSEQGNQTSVDVNGDFGYYCALLKHTERCKDTNSHSRLFKVTMSTPMVKILTEGSDDFRKFHIMMIPVFLTLVCLIAGCYHLLMNARIRWNILAAVILYLFNVSFKLFFAKISYRIYYEKAWKVDWFTYSVCDLVTLILSIVISLVLDSGLIYLLCVNVFENVFNDEMPKSVGTLGILFAFVMLRSIISLASGGFPVFEKSPPLLFNFQSEIPAGFWYNFVFYAIFVTFILSTSIGRLFQEFYDISYFTLKQNQSMLKKISMLKCIFLLSLLVCYLFLFELLHFSTHNDHKLWTLNAVESYLEKSGGLRYCFMALQGYVLTILGFIGCIAADVLESEAK